MFYLSAREETYEYDANGNLVSKLTPEAQEIIYEYDGHDRLMEKSYDDTAFEPWSITYTPNGQRKTVSRGGDLWEWSYEPLNGRLRTFTDPFGRSIDYGYDGNGNRTTVETAQGTTAWRYDPLGRVDRVTDRFDQETVLSYSPTSGLLDQVEYPNGVTTSYGYDPLGRVSSIEHSAGSTTLGSFTYTLGPTGRRNAVSETSSAHSGSVSYSYDDLDRLTGETRTGWPEAYTLSFVYDDVGNRREQTRGSTTRYYRYDERDRLLCENDADDCTTPLVSYTWDASGRMTDRGSESFSWDPEDRLLEHSGGSITEFLYDLDGIRYQSATGSTTTEYLVDANRPYQEVLEEWSGTGSQRDLGMEYAHGATGLLWQVDHAASGTPQRYLHGDAQLSTRVLTDTSGATSDAYRLTYEAFGADVAPPSTLPTSYRYTGQQADSATGGYYLRARHMDPTTGRFMSSDPFAGSILRPGSLHRFQYASASAPNRIDPDGQMDIGIIAFSVVMSLMATTTMASPGPPADTIYSKAGRDAQEDAAVLLRIAVNRLKWFGDTLFDDDASFSYWFGDPKAVPRRRDQPTRAQHRASIEKALNAMSEVASTKGSIQYIHWEDTRYAKSWHPKRRIGLADAFLRRPSTGAYDSKAGIIIHELVHIMLGSVDSIEMQKGQEGVLNLGPTHFGALRNPKIAAQEPDGYKYYCEENGYGLPGGPRP